MSQTVVCDLPPEFAALQSKLANWPEAAVLAIARGMNAGLELALGAISAERFTGQGPFPVEDHRLGIRTDKLRESLRRSPATIDGETVAGALGSNVEYLGIHEHGGTIHRTVKPGKVRLRTDRKGRLLKRGNLATFAKKSHKLSRDVSYAGGGTYDIEIPARAPLGHGIADHLTDIAEAQLAELRKTLEGRS